MRKPQLVSVNQIIQSRGFRTRALGTIHFLKQSPKCSCAESLLLSLIFDLYSQANTVFSLLFFTLVLYVYRLALVLNCTKTLIVLGIIL